jgi:hypothetical protein
LGEGNVRAIDSYRRYGLQTVTSRRWVGRLRTAGVVAGSLAALAMVVVGCQTLTHGTGSVNPSEAPIYRASVSASLEESSSRSAVSESKRQASLSKAAVHASCDQLSISSVDAVDAVNAFVVAFNDGAPDVAAKVSPAVEALNSSADLVASSLSAPLSDELEGALKAWVDAARNVANTIARTFDMAAFNLAVDQLNDVKTHALELCDAAY